MPKFQCLRMGQSLQDILLCTDREEPSTKKTKYFFMKKDYIVQTPKMISLKSTMDRTVLILDFPFVFPTDAI